MKQAHILLEENLGIKYALMPGDPGAYPPHCGASEGRAAAGKQPGISQHPG